jgi:hypothetical protein
MAEGDLIPPDFNRCQARMLMGSFMTLGPREWVRCSNVPEVIATERKPGDDGKRGEMALCGSCRDTLIKLDPAKATFRKIADHIERVRR